MKQEARIIRGNVYDTATPEVGMATGVESVIAGKMVWPFFLAATASAAARPNVNRIIEAVIIASLSAAATTYTMAKVTEARVTAVESSMTELKQDLRDLRQIMLTVEMQGRVNGR